MNMDELSQRRNGSSYDILCNLHMSYAGYKSVQATWHSGGSLLHCLDEATKGCADARPAKLRSCEAWHHRAQTANRSPISAPSQLFSPFSQLFFQVSIDAVLDAVSCFVSARSGALQVLLFESLTTAKGLRVRGRVEQGAVWPCKWRILPSEYLQVRVRIKHGSC